MTDRIVATNRKATLRLYDNGEPRGRIQLKGTEVKSLRAGKASLADSFARLEGGEIFLYNMHIPPYEFGNIANVDPIRPRKLLLHKKEIGWLVGEVTQKKLALIPLKLYFKERHSEGGAGPR